MNQREKKMLILLGVIAFLAGNLVLHSMYTDKKKSLEDQKLKLIEDNKVKDQILMESTEWNTTNTWLSQNQVKNATSEDAQNELLNEVKSAAERTKLLLNLAKPIRFLPPVEGSPYTRVRVSIDFTSTNEAFIEWVTQMNDPSKYRTVTNLTLKPNKDKYMVEVSANVEQWITIGSAVVEDPEKEQEGNTGNTEADSPSTDESNKPEEAPQS